MSRSNLPLDDFEPRKPTSERRVTPQEVDMHASFPSREAGETKIQLNIFVTRNVAERFKQLASDDRRSYGAMLEILLDNFGAN